MKKKHRDIVVDDEQFGWVLSNGIDGDGINRVSVYQNKKRLFITEIHDSEVTPKIVADLIRKKRTRDEKRKLKG